MNFHYKDYFKQAPAVGYETLIYDCLIGDATLFQRADQVEAAWALVEPVLEGWANTTPRHFPNYAAGSEGPSAANDLLARDGRSWRTDQLSAASAASCRHPGSGEGRRRAGGAGRRDHCRAACRRAAIPSVWCCRAAPRRAPPISFWPQRTWTGTACEIFFGDERFVPPDHPDSNYRMARETLLGRQGQPAQGVCHSRPTARRKAAADRYDEVLRQQYGAGTLEAGVPLFHLTLLGLGDDGHTASLLPGQPVLKERERWAARCPQGRAEPRITLTYPALEFQRTDPVSGGGRAKRDALAQARAGALPAGGLKPQGEIVVAGG